MFANSTSAYLGKRRALTVVKTLQILNLTAGGGFGSAAGSTISLAQ